MSFSNDESELALTGSFTNELDLAPMSSYYHVGSQQFLSHQLTYGFLRQTTILIRTCFIDRKQTKILLKFLAGTSSLMASVLAHD